MLKQNKENKIKRIFDFLHRNIIIIIIAVVILAGVVSMLTIVRDGGVTEEETVRTEEVTTVYLAMDRVASLNPLSSEDSDTFYISQLLFSSLFRLDETLNIETDLVSEYTANAAEGKVNIKLRKNAGFSDGSSLTAQDVSYTVSSIKSIGESSPYYSYAEKIESVQINGDYSLTVYFKDPADAALDNLIFPIVSSASYDADSDRSAASGQYCIGGYDQNAYLNLKPNKHYYGEKAQNKVRFKVVDDKSKVFGLMTMEAVTASVSRDSDADTGAEDRNLKVTKISSGEMEYLGFNFKNKYLSQKEVRQAVAKAINTESLISDNYGGSAVQSDSIYFPGFLGTENSKDAYDMDQKGAVDLLNSVGYRDADEDGYLEDDEGKRISMTILVNSSRKDTAAAIADALVEIGIDAGVKALDWAEYKEALADGKYGLYIGGYKLDKKSDLRMMFRKSKTAYDNPQVTEYVNRLETCLSAEKQKEVYEKLKPLLTEDLPYYCLCYKTYAFITLNRFESEGVPTFFDIYRGCSSWKWQKTVTEKQEEDAAEN